MNIRLVAAVAAIALVAVALGVTLSGKRGDGVRIGFVTTLTTASAAIGIDMRDGFDLAVEHMGGTMAGLPVTVFYEDDGLDPEIGRQKTERLVQRDGVQFISGYIWSNVLLASVHAAVEQGVFVIGANAGPSQLAGEGCLAWFFSTSWQNDQTPMAMGEVLNRRGVDNLYLLAPNYAAGRNMVAGIERTYRGAIAGTDMTQWPGQLDFSVELAKVRAANPGAVWVFYPGNHGTQFFTQYAQAGLLGVIPLYSTFSVDALNLPVIGPLVEGLLLTQHWSPDLDNAANRRFVDGFRARTGRTPSFYAAQAYDAAMLIRSAVEATGGDLDDKDALRRALEAADFESNRGDFAFNNNHFPIQDFYLREVVRTEDGGFGTRVVDKVYTAHRDPYAGQCAMTP
ncbi:MAG: ABC transporter substrate-binding protein [Proteobacteria bacterium]|nr:ABC transporter substrate-binding protein [Pseudomonadota bacterium]